MAQGLAGHGRQAVAEPHRRPPADRRQEELWQHQGEAAGPAAVLRLQHLGGEGDPTPGAGQETAEGLVVRRSLAAGPLKHHVDRHRPGAGRQQAPAQLAVGRPRPGQGVGATGPGRLVGAAGEPGRLLQAGVVDGYHNHRRGRTARAAPKQQLLLQIALPDPPARPRPSRRAAHPEADGGGQRRQDNGATRARGGEGHSGQGQRLRRCRSDAEWAATAPMAPMAPTAASRRGRRSGCGFPAPRNRAGCCGSR